MSSFGENKPGNRVIVSCYCEFYGLFHCSAQLVLVFAIDRPLHPHTQVRRLEAYLKKQLPENFTSRKKYKYFIWWSAREDSNEGIS